MAPVPAQVMMIPGPTCFPIPLRSTVAGLPAALCATDREADFGPSDAGANVTVIVLLSPGGIAAAVGETINCEASAPFTVIPAIESVSPPLFEIVNAF
ncbi:MAG: hypothetical protein A3F84_23905 [Candidatus Handelsmanbacteria bacterium RIFCSPLOWO2_12_FULL_64_10]|uniref:Uncharacterized protein n=1 Tax=Handelsmanbacteria sp. (strain RIFCSPLOWO2_12_FULL_64_10) TaxID=1817868 RepID=A0A1F6CA07_HANXR|nr:MAG: hypothetical protein A3F84_23905 [Candidatus Handelsmanbacteria bacterium RIFCSPLOWO2_12_FULL_64_10]